MCVHSVHIRTHKRSNIVETKQIQHKCKLFYMFYISYIVRFSVGFENNNLHQFEPIMKCNGIRAKYTNVLNTHTHKPYRHSLFAILPIVYKFLFLFNTFNYSVLNWPNIDNHLRTISSYSCFCAVFKFKLKKKNRNKCMKQWNMFQWIRNWEIHRPEWQQEEKKKSYQAHKGRTNSKQHR